MSSAFFLKPIHCLHLYQKAANKPPKCIHIQQIFIVYYVLGTEVCHKGIEVRRKIWIKD